QETALKGGSVRRAFQDETVLSNIWRGHHLAGQAVNFVTVLWPLPYASVGTERGPRVSVIESEPVGRGLAVRLRWQGEERLLAALNDLTVGYLQAEIRPRYTFQRGKTSYGPIASDAAFVYTRQRADRFWA